MSVEKATPANSDVDRQNLGGRYFMEESLPLPGTHTFGVFCVQPHDMAYRLSRDMV